MAPTRTTDLSQVTIYTSTSSARGEDRNGHRRIAVTFTPFLHSQILAEANRRNWSFAQMVRHLCESAIEGVE